MTITRREIIELIGLLAICFLMWNRAPRTTQDISPVIKAYDEQANEIKRIYNERLHEKDSTIAVKQFEIDNLSQQRSTQKVNYDKIRPHILSLGKDSLRAAGERFE